MSAEKFIAFWGYDVITLLLAAALGLILLLRRFLPGRKRREVEALLSAICAFLPVGREDLFLRLEKALLQLFLHGRAQDAAQTVRQVLKEHSSLSEEEIAAIVAAVRAASSGKKRKG